MLVSNIEAFTTLRDNRLNRIRYVAKLNKVCIKINCESSVRAEARYDYAGMFFITQANLVERFLHWI